jgi:hypothetical protein
MRDRTFDKKSVSDSRGLGQSLKTRQQELGGSYYVTDNGVIDGNTSSFLLKPTHCD